MGVEKYVSKQYLIYHLRWQASTVVMSGPITFFTWSLEWVRSLEMVPIPEVIVPALALSLAQFIGAIIFWYVDNWIFNDENMRTDDIEIVRVAEFCPECDGEVEMSIIEDPDGNVVGDWKCQDCGERWIAREDQLPGEIS